MSCHKSLLLLFHIAMTITDGFLTLCTYFVESNVDIVCGKLAAVSVYKACLLRYDIGLDLY